MDFPDYKICCSFVLQDLICKINLMINKHLLYVVDLIMLSFLISSNFPISAIAQICHQNGDIFHLAAGIFMFTSQVKAINLNPLIQSTVD